MGIGQTNIANSQHQRISTTSYRMLSKKMRFLHSIEHHTAVDSSGVDPTEARIRDATPARALALYLRLGYETIDVEPVLERWSFVDSDGVTHEGQDSVIYLRRDL